MKSFNHLSGLQQLLDIDTTLMKEELYYPWYIEKPGIIKIGLAWLSLCAVIISATYITSSYYLIIILVLLLLTIILGTNYFFLVKQKTKDARKQALNQVMQLEQRHFMEAIKPFVPSDQKRIAEKIINHKDFTLKEYAKITLSSKSRVIFNTDSFIREIERLFANPKVVVSLPKDDSYDEVKFKVPDSAKKKYEELKEGSNTFNESLEVTPEAKKAIVKKAYDAMNQAALGREEIARIKE